jgi:hypothetical protein
MDEHKDEHKVYVDDRDNRPVEPSRGGLTLTWPGCLQRVTPGSWAGPPL